MYVTQVLQYLKKHGQLLDSEISAGTGIPLPEVHHSLSMLAERRQISQCTVMQFKDGEPVNGMLCRILGYAPPAASGRKPAG